MAATATATATAKSSTTPALTLRVLSESEVERCLTMEEAIRIQAEAFIAAATGNAVVPDRIMIPNGSHTATDGSTLFKPALIHNPNGEASLGLKVVAVRPDNAVVGLPSVPAVIMLTHKQYGFPIAVMSATYL